MATSANSSHFKAVDVHTHGSQCSGKPCNRRQMSKTHRPRPGKVCWSADRWAPSQWNCAQTLCRGREQQRRISKVWRRTGDRRGLWCLPRCVCTGQTLQTSVTGQKTFHSHGACWHFTGSSSYMKYTLIGTVQHLSRTVLVLGRRTRPSRYFDLLIWLH